MKSIEARIDQLLKKCFRGGSPPLNSIIHWKLKEQQSHYLSFYRKILPDGSDSEIEFLIKEIGNPYDMADVLINKASTSECLTSPSEYVRKRKLFFLQEEANANSSHRDSSV